MKPAQWSGAHKQPLKCGGYTSVCTCVFVDHQAWKEKQNKSIQTSMKPSQQTGNQCRKPVQEQRNRRCSVEVSRQVVMMNKAPPSSVTSADTPALSIIDGFQGRRAALTHTHTHCKVIEFIITGGSVRKQSDKHRHTQPKQKEPQSSKHPDPLPSRSLHICSHSRLTFHLKDWVSVSDQSEWSGRAPTHRSSYLMTLTRSGGGAHSFRPPAIVTWHVTSDVISSFNHWLSIREHNVKKMTRHVNQSSHAAELIQN